MTNKRFNQLYLFLTGCLLLFISFLIMNKKILLLSFFNLLIPIVLIVDSFSHFLRSFQNKENRKKWCIRAFIALFLATLCFISTLPFQLLATLFGLYICIKGMALLATYYSYRMNNQPNRLYLLAAGLCESIIGLLLLFSSLFSETFILNIVASYFLLMGLSNLYLTISPHSINQLKRKIRLTPPVFIDAFVPLTVLKKTNALLKPEDNNQTPSFKLQEKKSDIIPDLEIFIHVTEKSFGSIGHMDICFNGKVISYGNYDADSVRFFETVGDGVLVTGANKEDYIPFCIKHDKKTLFGFGILLTNEERAGLIESIENIQANSYEWQSHYQREKDSAIKKTYSDYASYLTQATNCQLHKFTKGTFKTYFVLTTNCVLLADTILGPTGIDLLTVNGILTPGTYLEFLRNEFKRKDSNVVTFNIYH